MTEATITFFIISLFLVISPGPNMALIVDNASRLGKKHAMANVLGLCTATYAHGALSIWGVSAILVSNNLVYSLVKLLGAAYLLYLGFKSVKSGINIIRTRSIEEAHKCISRKGAKTSRSYIDGFLTQILNPKVSIFYIAAFPNFLTPGDGIERGFELVAIHSFNIFWWFTALTFFISFARSTLRKPKVHGYTCISTGIVLSLFSVFIFIG